MSLDFKLTNNNLINYARTDDAHEAFVNSVGNGQARLALEVLVDLINGIVEKLDELDQKINPLTEISVAPVVDSGITESELPPAEEAPKPKTKQAKVEQPSDKEVDNP